MNFSAFIAKFCWILKSSLEVIPLVYSRLDCSQLFQVLAVVVISVPQMDSIFALGYFKGLKRLSIGKRSKFQYLTPSVLGLIYLIHHVETTVHRIEVLCFILLNDFNDLSAENHLRACPIRAPKRHTALPHFHQLLGPCARPELL